MSNELSAIQNSPQYSPYVGNIGAVPGATDAEKAQIIKALREAVALSGLTDKDQIEALVNYIYAGLNGQNDFASLTTATQLNIQAAVVFAIVLKQIGIKIDVSPEGLLKKDLASIFDTAIDIYSKIRTALPFLKKIYNVKAASLFPPQLQKTIILQYGQKIETTAASLTSLRSDNTRLIALGYDQKGKKTTLTVERFAAGPTPALTQYVDNGFYYRYSDSDDLFLQQLSNNEIFTPLDPGQEFGAKEFDAALGGWAGKQVDAALEAADGLTTKPFESLPAGADNRTLAGVAAAIDASGVLADARELDGLILAYTDLDTGSKLRLYNLFLDYARAKLQKNYGTWFVSFDSLSPEEQFLIIMSAREQALAYAREKIAANEKTLAALPKTHPRDLDFPLKQKLALRFFGNESWASRVSELDQIVPYPTLWPFDDDTTILDSKLVREAAREELEKENGGLADFLATEAELKADFELYSGTVARMQAAADQLITEQKLRFTPLEDKIVTPLFAEELGLDSEAYGAAAAALMAVRQSVKEDLPKVYVSEAGLAAAEKALAELAGTAAKLFSPAYQYTPPRPALSLAARLDYLKTAQVKLFLLFDSKKNDLPAMRQLGTQLITVKLPAAQRPVFETRARLLAEGSFTFFALPDTFVGQVGQVKTETVNGHPMELVSPRTSQPLPSEVVRLVQSGGFRLMTFDDLAYAYDSARRRSEFVPAALEPLEQQHNIIFTKKLATMRAALAAAGQKPEEATEHLRAYELLIDGTYSLVISRDERHGSEKYFILFNNKDSQRVSLEVIDGEASIPNTYKGDENCQKAATLAPKIIAAHRALLLYRNPQTTNLDPSRRRPENLYLESIVQVGSATDNFLMGKTAQDIALDIAINLRNSILADHSELAGKPNQLNEVIALVINCVAPALNEALKTENQMNLPALIAAAKKKALAEFEKQIKTGRANISQGRENVEAAVAFIEGTAGQIAAADITDESAVQNWLEDNQLSYILTEFGITAADLIVFNSEAEAKVRGHKQKMVHNLNKEDDKVDNFEANITIARAFIGTTVERVLSSFGTHKMKKGDDLRLLSQKKLVEAFGLIPVFAAASITPESGRANVMIGGPTAGLLLNLKVMAARVDASSGPDGRRQYLISDSSGRVSLPVTAETYPAEITGIPAGPPAAVGSAGSKLNRISLDLSNSRAELPETQPIFGFKLALWTETAGLQFRNANPARVIEVGGKRRLVAVAAVDASDLMALHLLFQNPTYLLAGKNRPSDEEMAAVARCQPYLDSRRPYFFITKDNLMRSNYPDDLADIEFFNFDKSHLIAANLPAGMSAAEKDQVISDARLAIRLIKRYLNMKITTAEVAKDTLGQASVTRQALDPHYKLRWDHFVSDVIRDAQSRVGKIQWVGGRLPDTDVILGDIVSAKAELFPRDVAALRGKTITPARDQYLHDGTIDSAFVRGLLGRKGPEIFLHQTIVMALLGTFPADLLTPDPTKSAQEYGYDAYIADGQRYVAFLKKYLQTHKIAWYSLNPTTGDDEETQQAKRIVKTLVENYTLNQRLRPLVDQYAQTGQAETLGALWNLVISEAMGAVNIADYLVRAEYSLPLGRMLKNDLYTYEFGKGASAGSLARLSGAVQGQPIQVNLSDNLITQPVVESAARLMNELMQQLDGGNADISRVLALIELFGFDFSNNYLFFEKNQAAKLAEIRAIRDRLKQAAKDMQEGRLGPFELAYLNNGDVAIALEFVAKVGLPLLDILTARNSAQGAEQKINFGASLFLAALNTKAVDLAGRGLAEIDILLPGSSRDAGEAFALLSTAHGEDELEAPPDNIFTMLFLSEQEQTMSESLGQIGRDSSGRDRFQSLAQYGQTRLYFGFVQRLAIISLQMTLGFAYQTGQLTSHPNNPFVKSRLKQLSYTQLMGVFDLIAPFIPAAIFGDIFMKARQQGLVAGLSQSAAYTHQGNMLKKSLTEPFEIVKRYALDKFGTPIANRAYRGWASRVRHRAVDVRLASVTSADRENAAAPTKAGRAVALGKRAFHVTSILDANPWKLIVSNPANHLLGAVDDLRGGSPSASGAHDNVYSFELASSGQAQGDGRGSLAARARKAVTTAKIDFFEAELQFIAQSADQPAAFDRVLKDKVFSLRGLRLSAEEKTGLIEWIKQNIIIAPGEPNFDEVVRVRDAAAARLLADLRAAGEGPNRLISEPIRISSLSTGETYAEAMARFNATAGRARAVVARTLGLGQDGLLWWKKGWKWAFGRGRELSWFGPGKKIHDEIRFKNTGWGARMIDWFHSFTAAGVQRDLERAARVYIVETPALREAVVYYSPQFFNQSIQAYLTNNEGGQELRAQSVGQLVSSNPVLMDRMVGESGQFIEHSLRAILGEEIDLDRIRNINLQTETDPAMVKRKVAYDFVVRGLKEAYAKTLLEQRFGYAAKAARALYGSTGRAVYEAKLQARAGRDTLSWPGRAYNWFRRGITGREGLTQNALRINNAIDLGGSRYNNSPLDTVVYINVDDGRVVRTTKKLFEQYRGTGALYGSLQDKAVDLKDGSQPQRIADSNVVYDLHMRFQPKGTAPAAPPAAEPKPALVTGLDRTATAEDAVADFMEQALISTDPERKAAAEGYRQLAEAGRIEAANKKYPDLAREIEGVVRVVLDDLDKLDRSPRYLADSLADVLGKDWISFKGKFEGVSARAQWQFLRAVEFASRSGLKTLIIEAEVDFGGKNENALLELIDYLKSDKAARRSALRVYAAGSDLSYNFSPKIRVLGQHSLGGAATSLPEKMPLSELIKRLQITYGISISGNLAVELDPAKLLEFLDACQVKGIKQLDFTGVDLTPDLLARFHAQLIDSTGNADTIILDRTGVIRPTPAPIAAVADKSLPPYDLKAEPAPAEAAIAPSPQPKIAELAGSYGIAIQNLDGHLGEVSPEILGNLFEASRKNGIISFNFENGTPLTDAKIKSLLAYLGKNQIPECTALTFNADGTTSFVNDEVEVKRIGPKNRTITPPQAGGKAFHQLAPQEIGWEIVKPPAPTPELTVIEGGASRRPRIAMSTLGSAASGFVVEIPVSLMRQYFGEKGEISLRQTLEDAAHAGIGWAIFGFLQGAAMNFLGYSPAGAMIFAITLPTSWTLAQNPAQGGQILAHSAAGIGGFTAGIKFAKKFGLDKLPRGVGHLAVLFCGVVGATGAGKLLEVAADKKIGAFTLKYVLDSRAANGIARAVGAAAGPVNTYYGSRIAASALLRAVPSTLSAASIARFSNIFGLLSVVAMIPGDSATKPSPYGQLTLTDVAQSDTALSLNDPRLLIGSDSEVNQLGFQIMLALSKAGKIERGMIPGYDREHWDRFMNIFADVDLNHQPSVAAAFDRYQEFMAWRRFLPYPRHASDMVQQVLQKAFADSNITALDRRTAAALITALEQAAQIEATSTYKISHPLVKMGVASVTIVQEKISSRDAAFDQLLPHKQSLISYVGARTNLNSGDNRKLILERLSQDTFRITLDGKTKTVRFYSDGGWKSQ
ncbi:hypothetical protein A3D23_02260 [candidate division WOR-1 bacterium RIFCSPHIGHO2_02_FULL_53_26]|nr:MAG: hypothetical protein A3D23_02260 [candidate division WOR-1 bacterium RIFCSPHIGHO2_02_FULL_53_26]